MYRLNRYLVGLMCGVQLLVTPALSYAADLEDVLNMDVVVHIVDVGIGDAILIELPNSEHEVIIDGGHAIKGFKALHYFEDYIDGPIELAVITHPDYDHWSGIKKLFDNDYQIQEFWDPGYDRKCKKNPEKDTYLKFIKEVKKEAAKSSPQRKVLKLRRPFKITDPTPHFSLDNVTFTVLHSDENPPGKECAYITNNASMVIMMQYKKVRFLFAGDINGKERDDRPSVEPKYIEGKLLQQEAKHPGLLKADVYKVPHHGSETANTRKFIKAVSPRFALISSSYDAHFELPTKRILRLYQRIRVDDREKIEKVLRTNYGESDYDHRNYGDDHIICGTNGDPDDIICDYIWNLGG